MRAFGALQTEVKKFQGDGDGSVINHLLLSAGIASFVFVVRGHGDGDGWSGAE